MIKVAMSLYHYATPDEETLVLDPKYKRGSYSSVSMKLRIPQSLFTWTQTTKKDFLLIEGSIKLTFRQNGCMILRRPLRIS